ncbi:hypothetical protein [Haloferula sp.]|uniref:hypothetical protein n=1 Tax=Haloferula sp. TaxID=2497595 RepID=UPI00329AAD18
MLRIFALMAILTSQVSACLWDRDTLAEETKGRADTSKLIVGWFDRYPPRYYEMRLERVTAELEKRQGDLNLHDDAAVACDRLGRHDEAIEWMERKKALLDALPAADVKEHHYRYLANLGTFHAHRWIALPQTERDLNLADLRVAEKLVAQAIHENPDAHFGREIYQLLAIRWMLWDGDQDSIELDPDSGLMIGRDGWIHDQGFPRSDVFTRMTVEGIGGLIQLGAAWQSLDAFHALTRALRYDELASLAHLSFNRELELYDAGSRSIHPLKSVRDKVHPSQPRETKHREPADEFFVLARAAAVERNKSWNNYQTEQFEKGLHPDTHPDFWNAWVEPEFPSPPGPTLKERLGRLIKDRFGLVASIFIVTMALITVVIVDFIRRRKVQSQQRTSTQ